MPSMADNGLSMEGTGPLERKKILGKSVWEWMQVALVPFSIALVTLVFSLVQSCTQMRVETERSQDATLQHILAT